MDVAGRASRQAEQAAAVAAVGADVVALQEVTARTLPLWRAALAGRRLAAATDARHGAPRRRRRRPLGVLTAAREPLERLAGRRAVPWPERVARAAPTATSVVNLHSPIAPAPELAKVRTHEAVAAYLVASHAAARPLRRPQHAAPRARRRRRAHLRP